MRIIYNICRFFLFLFYSPCLLLTRKYPKYRDRLGLYRYGLQRRFLASEKGGAHRLHSIRNLDGTRFKMLLRSPGKIEDQLLALNRFEDHITRIMPHFMKPDSVFLDIGANIGFHTFNVLAHHPDAVAYCFEPNPEIKHELDRNIHINDWQDRIFTSQTALSDQAGEFDFFIMPQTEENRGMSSLVPEAVDSRFEKITVCTDRFDAFWKNTAPLKKRISLVKIDTQGHEEFVLRGMLDVIDRDRPTLFLEFETHLAKDKSRLWDLYRKLETAYNYDFFIISKNGFGLDPISFDKLPVTDYSVDIIGLQGRLKG